MKKTIEEMIAVMQAFKDGKEIEFYDKSFGNSLGTCTWYSTDAPSWDWYGCDYRVKQEPKCRPYANADECFADVKKHGEWVKNTAGEYINIISITNDFILYKNERTFSYECAYRHWVWADDGTPCGVKEE